MDPFTQKLLERTKARKDALTKKRQEWEQVAVSDNESSRKPLTKKDLNENSSSTGIRDIKNVFEKPKENATARSKRQSPTKVSTVVREKKAKPTVQPTESMIGTPRSGRTARDNKTQKPKKDTTENLFECQKKVNNADSNSSSARKGREPRGSGSSAVTNESIQERLSRLEEQRKKKAEEVIEQKRKRQNDIESSKMARERMYEAARKKDKMDVKRHSASVDEKLAMFENARDDHLTEDRQPELTSRHNRLQPPKTAVYTADKFVAESDTDGYEAGLDYQTGDETDVIPTESEFETDVGDTDVGETDMYETETDVGDTDVYETETDVGETDVYETEDESAFHISGILKEGRTEQYPESNVDTDFDMQSVDELNFKETEQPMKNPIVVDISYNKRSSNKKKQAPKKPARNFNSNSDLETDIKPIISSPKKQMDCLSPIKKKSDYVNVASGSPLKNTLSTNKRRMRRSISFSEGQGKPLFKSGFNEEASKNYDANGSCANNVVVEMSNKEKIQDLLEEAASQQNIVLQTSQALNVNEYDEKQGSPEVIEGHRLLLLATERKNACLEEVQILKNQNGKRNTSTKKDETAAVAPCKAKLVISEVKLPLNHEFMKALRSGKLDLGVFHFVVLVQYGPKKVYATSAVSSFDAVEANSIPLASKIVINDVPHDFCLTIKVFGMHTKRQTDFSGKGKKPNSKDNNGRMKNVISSLTPRKKESVQELQALNASPKTVFRTSNFMPVGQTKIDVTMIRSEKHVLCKVPGNCPLDGFIQLRVDCLPQFTAQARGFLTIFQDVGGYTAWNRRWCLMNGNNINFWRYPDEESSKGPLGEIDLKWVDSHTVGLVSRDQCARPNTFEIIFKKPLNQHDKPGILSTVEGKDLLTKCWISTDTKDDRLVWLTTINRQLSDYNAWSDLDKQNTKGKHAFHVVNPCNRYNDPRNSPASVYV